MAGVERSGLTFTDYYHCDIHQKKHQEKYMNERIYLHPEHSIMCYAQDFLRFQFLSSTEKCKEGHFRLIFFYHPLFHASCLLYICCTATLIEQIRSLTLVCIYSPSPLSSSLGLCYNSCMFIFDGHFAGRVWRVRTKHTICESYSILATDLNGNNIYSLSFVCWIYTTGHIFPIH